MYAIYDLKENEACIGIFDSCKEVAEYFNTTTNTIYSLISHGYKRKKRFEIVSIKESKYERDKI